MRLDFILFALGILLAVAMVLTLLYGKKHSRHGYGQALPLEQELMLGVSDCRCPGVLRTAYGCPRRIG